MISLPVFERLSIKEYGLYPSTDPNVHELDVVFQPGLTLLLGANGLGKTTFVHILYRLLTGPWDITALSTGSDLGSASLDPTPVKPKTRKMFGNRVSDNAENAVARLRLHIGEHTVTIKRNLQKLDLISCEVKEGDRLVTEEKDFQALMVELSGLDSFSSWILVLRYIVFYFEDRKALLWDQSAQRQLLRALFLSERDSITWNDEARDILILDSKMRNTNATYSHEKAALEKLKKSIDGMEGLEAELKTLLELQQVDVENKQRLKNILDETESERFSSRATLLKAQEDHDSAKREYERAKLIILQSQFPSCSETARYILSQVLTDNDCLVCGAKNTNAYEKYEQRISENRCVICSSNITNMPDQDSISLAMSRLEKSEEKLEQHSNFVSESLERSETAARTFEAITNELGKLNKTIHERSLNIKAVQSQLPPEDANLSTTRAGIDVLGDLVEGYKAELKDKRALFSQKMENWNRIIHRKSDQVREAFNSYAKHFLFEECDLNWAPVQEPLGQTGIKISFPAFALDMSGSDFPAKMRRDSPEQVSESQREFIDLSFRIALMAVTGSTGASLIIDAPESSLDSIFVERAATTLNKFANPDHDNRLIITSNLIEGNLIPCLLEGNDENERQSRIVNLFEAATPTAAVREYRDEYMAKFKELTQPQQRGG